MPHCLIRNNWFVYSGKLVKLLVHTGVTRYLEFKKVDGSFVYTMEQGGLFSSGGGKIYKVYQANIRTSGNRLVISNTCQFISRCILTTCWMCSHFPIIKVPGNQSEALKSSLMGFMEKKSFGSFVARISKLQENEEAQWLSRKFNKVWEWEKRVEESHIIIAPSAHFKDFMSEFPC